MESVPWRLDLCHTRLGLFLDSYAERGDGDAIGKANSRCQGYGGRCPVQLKEEKMGRELDGKRAQRRTKGNKNKTDEARLNAMKREFLTIYNEL
jgi:hypothetical protein